MVGPAPIRGYRTRARRPVQLVGAGNVLPNVCLCRKGPGGIWPGQVNAPDKQPLDPVALREGLAVPFLGLFPRLAGLLERRLPLLLSIGCHVVRAPSGVTLFDDFLKIAARALIEGRADILQFLFQVPLRRGQVIHLFGRVRGDVLKGGYLRMEFIARIAKLADVTFKLAMASVEPGNAIS